MQVSSGSNLDRRVRLGMITPSSNSSLEPVTMAMLRDEPDVSMHCSRFPIRKITLDTQIQIEAMIDAAVMLSDASVDVIAYNGTSGSWLGLDWDRDLCNRIFAVTNIPVTTATLATVDALRSLEIRSLGLIFPGLAEIGAKIVKVYESEGFQCINTVFMGITNNLEIDAFSSEHLESLISSAAVDGIDGIAVLGTNFRGATVVQALEGRLGVPIIDSTAATLWKMLQLANAKRPINGWGRLLKGETAVQVAK
jgi:maleate isomerase